MNHRHSRNIQDSHLVRGFTPPSSPPMNWGWNIENYTRNIVYSTKIIKYEQKIVTLKYIFTTDKNTSTNTHLSVTLQGNIQWFAIFLLTHCHYQTKRPIFLLSIKNDCHIIYKLAFLKSLDKTDTEVKKSTMF